MASGSKVDLRFASSLGKELKFVYSNINPEVQVANVQALMNGMIANGSIFETAPAIIKGATLIETTETSLNVSPE